VPEWEGITGKMVGDTPSISVSCENMHVFLVT
jgi:hypothetical protein